MTSDLDIFAARLRNFIRICADEPALLDLENNPELEPHADMEFNGMALVLFALQFANNIPYRKLCEARGIRPETITHWKQIPTVPAAAFKELELTCLPPAQRTRVFFSSGTTEQRPSRHFHSKESLAVYEASLWPWFKRHLPVADHRLVILTPSPDQVPHSSLVHMFDVVRKNLGAPQHAFMGATVADGSWTLDFQKTVQALDHNHNPETPQPKMVTGTAFSFVHLLDELAERNLNIKLPPGSHVLETGGYKGRSRSMPKAELHALITMRLGVPPSHIVCEYGMSELSSQAYDLSPDATRNTQHPRRQFRFPPWARAQIISPETGHEAAIGETGLIRVFDLANVYSVMAIQTEDLAVRREHGFELLGRAQSAETRGCSLMAV